MATMTQRVKWSILTRMARSGYALMRTDPRERPALTHYDPELYAKIEGEVRGLGLNAQDWEVWTTPEAVMSYLQESRANSYHQTVQLCHEHDLDLTGKSVLDVGTCSGYLLRIIEQEFADVTLSGTDYYQEHVRLTEALAPGARIFRASIDDLAEQDMTFDVIFCTEVLEHILDTETPIPRLIGLTNPGGTLIVTVPNGRFDSTGPASSDDGVSYAGHVNYWTEESWRFYLQRITTALSTPVSIATGTHGGQFDGDVLFAVIRRI